MQAWKDGKRNKREGYERQVCHRVTCKNYKRKECIHGDINRVKEQYFPANSDVWIRDLDMK